MELEKVNETSQALAVQLKSFPAIRATDEYVKAGELLTVGRGVLKQLDDAYDPLIEANRKAWKLALAKKAEYYDPIEAGTKGLKSLMQVYDAEQERIRLAEERRLQEEARKQEEERRLQEAIEAEKSGNKEEAEEIITAPIETPVVTVQRSTPKVVGVSFSVRWSAEVVNLMELVKAVADGKANIEYLQANTVTLNRVAIALKSNMDVPGVKAVSKRG